MEKQLTGKRRLSRTMVSVLVLALVITMIPAVGGTADVKAAGEIYGTIDMSTVGGDVIIRKATGDYMEAVTTGAMDMPFTTGTSMVITGTSSAIDNRGVTIDGTGTDNGADYRFDVVLSGTSISFNAGGSKSPVKLATGAAVDMEIREGTVSTLRFPQGYAGINVSSPCSISMTGRGELYILDKDTNNVGNDSNAAAIGGNDNESGNNIMIGGSVSISAISYQGAGIGGGRSRDGTNITIEDSVKVYAWSNQGAGIGGGYLSDGTDILIKDSARVHAVSYGGGAGIGGGDGSGAPAGRGMRITISGGFVTASSDFGDDIGNGSGDSGTSTPAEDIVINGGSVYAVNSNIASKYDGPGPVAAIGSSEKVYRTAVPVKNNINGSSLIGGLDISIPVGSDTYKAKTVSSAAEHDFTTHVNITDIKLPDDVSAYVYLPAKSYTGIKVGTNADGFADVVSTVPTSAQNTVYWKAPAAPDDPQPTVIKTKITFNANKGKVSQKKKISRNLVYGEKYGTLPKAKRTGYKFTGWYTKKSGGKKITSKTIMNYKSSRTLYAHWKKNGKIVNCKSAYIRKPAGVSNPKIGHVKRGQKVSILKKTKRGGKTWYKVKAGSRTGWVYGKYVKKV